MLLFTAILMIVAGVLAAASLIAAKQPNAQQAIDKLVPFQGIVGIQTPLGLAAIGIGLWALIHSVMNGLI